MSSFDLALAYEHSYCVIYWIGSYQCCNPLIFRVIISPVTYRLDNKFDAILIAGWQEECTRFPAGDALWCIDGGMYDVTKGPFIVFTADGPDRKAIYRCLKGGMIILHL